MLAERAAARQQEIASTDAGLGDIAAVYFGGGDPDATARALERYGVDEADPNRPILLPYQARWVTGDGRRHLLNKARRIGGSFSVALKDALRAIGWHVREDGTAEIIPERGVPQRIVSASEDQAQELLGECLTHLEVIEMLSGLRLIEAQSLQRIILTSGIKLVALAPSPRTVRGGHGDVTLDEFAHMPNTERVWQASKSITDPTIARPDGYHLNVVSTPFGDDNMFYRLAETDAGQHFEKHTVDIYAAREQGFPSDPVEQLREEAGDEDSFRQEYCCEFLSAQTRYIAAELFDSCLVEGNEMPDPGRLAERFAGMDVARKSTGDLSAVAKLYRVGSSLYDDGLETRRGERWSEQMSWADDVIRGATRFAVDATGMGSQFAEGLEERHGSRVLPVEFTNRSKEQVITGLRLAMERGGLRIRSDSEYVAKLRRAVLSLRREITAAGNVRYDAERTKDGHADEAIALGLAVHAAGSRPMAVPKVHNSGRRRVGNTFREAF